MDSESYKVSIVRDGAKEDGTLRVIETDAVVRLELATSRGSFEQEAPDCLTALHKMRPSLQARGLDIYCYGFSRRAGSSGMSRSMSRGRKVYRLSIGRSTSLNDLVCVFDSGPDVELVSTEEQRAFFEQWKAGFMSR